MKTKKFRSVIAKKHDSVIALPTTEDIRQFHKSLDFAALWQEFYLALKPNGSLLWQTVRSFITKYPGWSAVQRDFMYWLLGPETPIDDDMVRVYGSWYEPQNWDEKRRTGGWYSEEAIRDYSKSIRDKIDALDSLRAVGNGVTVNALVRVERLMQQLDKEFGGRFFIESLTPKANAERATLYVRLQKQLLDMLDQAQEIYAKSHGISFNDMSGFEKLLAAQLMTRNVEVKQDNGRKVMEKLIEMTLEKSVKYDTPMPEGVKETALTVLRKERKVN